MNLSEAIEQIPYAKQLGIVVCNESADALVFELAPEDRFIGNPMLQAFHGGIICGVMECALSLTVMKFNNLNKPPRLINLTTSFLGSAGMDAPLRVQTELTKSGRRILGGYARAYQSSESQLIAKCSSLFAVRS